MATYLVRGMRACMCHHLCICKASENCYTINNTLLIFVVDASTDILQSLVELRLVYTNEVLIFVHASSTPHQSCTSRWHGTQYWSLPCLCIETAVPPLHVSEVGVVQYVSPSPSV